MREPTSLLVPPVGLVVSSGHADVTVELEHFRRRHQPAVVAVGAQGAGGEPGAEHGALEDRDRPSPGILQRLGARRQPGAHHQPEADPAAVRRPGGLPRAGSIQGQKQPGPGSGNSTLNHQSTLPGLSRRLGARQQPGPHHSRETDLVAAQRPGMQGTAGRASLWVLRSALMASLRTLIRAGPWLPAGERHSTQGFGAGSPDLITNLKHFG